MSETGLPRIADIALNIVDSTEGPKWGQEMGDLAPVYNPVYTGGGANSAGDMKAPGFLEGNWKCSVFIAELLFRAGFEPPGPGVKPAHGHHALQQSGQSQDVGA